MDVLNKQKDIYNKLRPDYPRSKDELKELLAQKDVNNLIIEIANKIAGSISFEKKEENTIELARLWIAQDFRKAGLSGKIMKTLVQYVHNTYDTKEICTQILQSNEKVIRMCGTIEGVELRHVPEKTIELKDKEDKLLYFTLHLVKISNN